MMKMMQLCLEMEAAAADMKDDAEMESYTPAELQRLVHLTFQCTSKFLALYVVNKQCDPISTDLKSLLCRLPHPYQRIFVDLKNDFGMNILHQACVCGHLPLVKMLVEDMGADVFTATADWEEYVSIHLAASNGHVEIVKFLSQHHPGLLNFQDPYGDDALTLAAKDGNLDVVCYIVDNFPHEIDLERRARRGRTVLLWACESDNAQLVKYLVEKGADFRSEDCSDEKSRNAAHIAASCDCLSTLCFLLTLDFNYFISSKTTDGNTLLHSAIEACSERCTRFLIESLHFDLESKIIGGMTPLLLAAIAGSLALVEYLIERGADWRCQNENGSDWIAQGNALHLALRMGNSDVIDYFIFNFPELITSPNANNVTPLDIASASCRAKMHLILSKPAMAC